MPFLHPFPVCRTRFRRPIKPEHLPGVAVACKSTTTVVKQHADERRTRIYRGEFDVFTELFSAVEAAVKLTFFGIAGSNLCMVDGHGWSWMVMAIPLLQRGPFGIVPRAAMLLLR